jgi:hypothetical protein
MTTTFSNTPGSKAQIEQGIEWRAVEGGFVQERCSAASLVVHGRGLRSGGGNECCELAAVCLGGWPRRRACGVMIVRVGSRRGLDGGGGVVAG